MVVDTSKFIISLIKALKSFLYARRIDETKLKRDFGHDLVRLLEKAQELEIGRLVDITPEMKARISL